MDWLLLIIGLYLLIIAIIDLKVKAIPSMILTGMLFVVVMLHPANLFYGISAFIVAFLLYESDFYSGVADIKVMTTLGFLIASTNILFAFIIMILLYGIAWKIIQKRTGKDKQIAFIPVFLFVYVTLLIIGGIK